jgi:hypothetical protein
MAAEQRNEYLDHRLVAQGSAGCYCHQQARKKTHGNLRWNLPQWVAGTEAIMRLKDD